MALLNTLQCGLPGTGNTGTGSCVVNLARIVGIILVPKGTEIAFTDLDTLKTNINAAILNDNPLARYYPVNRLVPQADNSEDLSIQTYPDGTKLVTGEGDFDWTFDLLEGKNCLASRLRKHNFTSEDVLLIDDQNQLLGVEGSTSASIKGFAPTISFALAPVLSQGNDAVTAYRYRLSFSKKQLADQLAIAFFGSDAYLKNLRGLQDVALSKVSRAANVLNIAASTACGSVNMFDLYSTQMANAANWVATNAAGAIIDITSVAASTNGKYWVVTVSTSDPDYTVGAPILVKWAGPTVLNTSLVKGFESNQITVTV